MSPIRLSRGERAALRKLVRLEGSCRHHQLKNAHADRFLRHGLLARTPTEYHLTVRGQVEFLRQRFRGLRGSTAGVEVSERTSVLVKDAFG